MTGSKLEREQKWLATEMNVPYVEENLYLKSLQNKDISYETRLTSFESEY